MIESSHTMFIEYRLHIRFVWLILLINAPFYLTGKKTRWIPDICIGMERVK